MNLLSYDHNILFVIGTLHVGGAEKQLSLLVNELIHHKVKCEVFVLNLDGPLVDDLKKAGITLHDGKYVGGGSMPGRYIRMLISLFRLLYVTKKGKYDVIHGYLPLTSFFAVIVGRLLRVPLVISGKRGLGTHQDRNRGWRHIDQLTNYLSDKITVNSLGVWDDSVKRENVETGKLVLIYNGIDVSTYKCDSNSRMLKRNSLGIRNDEIAIIMIANLISYKGHSDALKALKQVTNVHDKVKMICVGDDRGIQVELEGEADNLGVLDKVLFLGRRGDIPDLLCASDIGLIASHEEGFCNALLEKMAASLPVVATDVGGNREALDGGNAGMLVGRKDVESIARSLIQFIEDSELRLSMGALAHNVVINHYSINGLVSNSLKLYRSEKCQ